MKRGRLRLFSLKERNDLRGEQMKAQEGRFASLKARHENGTAPKAVSAFNLFQSTALIAAQVLDLADLQAGQRVLEPSAGLGRLIDVIPSGCEIVACEQSPELCEELFRKYPAITVKCGDFMDMYHVGLFDRVLMNPPFKNGVDIKHIMHAYDMLKPDGVLVAICANGPRQTRELQPLADSWQVLPPSSFKESGTMVNAVILSMRK